MGEKLARVYEYRVLLSRQAETGAPLPSADHARLVRLGQELPAGVPSVDERNLDTLLTTPLPAQLLVGGRFGAGIVRNVSSEGLAIVTAEPPQLAERLIVHVRAPEQELEYTFPCRVLSRVVKGVLAVGVKFEGAPSESRLNRRESGVWRFDDGPSAPPGRKDRSA